MRPLFQKLQALAVIATLLGGVSTAHADSKTSAEVSEEPAQLVLRISSNVIDAVKTDRAVQSGDATAVQKLVEERILPYVDFEKTTRLAVGRAWRQATPEQRVQLTSEFRTLLTRTYAGA